MTTSVGSVVRVAALVVVAVVLQLAVVSQVTVLGANADLTPLIALSVGLLGGPVAGALTGFSVGLAVDMALVQTLGVTSMLLTAVGYLSGRYRELRDTSHSLVPPVAAAVATLAFAAGFSVIQFLLGVESSVSALVIRNALFAALLNAVIAGPVFAVVRSVLRPCLIEPEGPRRRSTVTGLRVTQ